MGVRIGAPAVTTALVIAVAAAVLGAAIVLVVAYRRRGDRASAGEAGRAPSSQRVEDELRRTQSELKRTRQLASLTETLDLDELLGRVLQSATRTVDADAAAVSIWQEGEPPIAKAMNLTPEEAAPLLGNFQQESRPPRALTVRYRFPGEANSGSSIELGVLLPLVAEEAVVGTLAVFWRRAAEELKEEELAALEELALAAGKALENARQFHELHELAVRDPLSGLHNRRYFHETLEQEVKRAHRYDRRLALIFFDLDDFKAINEDIGHLGGDAVLAEVAQRLRSVTRGADIPCRVGGDEFAVILPESSLEDAERFFVRLQLAIHGQPIGRVPTMQVSAGMAELCRDDDATSLFRRVDEALYRAKRSGKGIVVAADDPGELR